MQKSFNSVLKVFSIVAASMLLLAGCSKGGGEYVGLWRDVDHPNDEKAYRYEIKKNGDSFLVTGIRTVRDYSGVPEFKFPLPDPKTLPKKEERNTISAKYVDGGLEITGILGSARMVIDKSNGQLLVMGKKYEKVN